jgi:hypothetical protein
MPPSFPFLRGGGGIFNSTIRKNKNSSKKVVTLRVGGTGTDPAFKAERDEPGPPKVNHHISADHHRFRTPDPPL